MAKKDNGYREPAEIVLSNLTERERLYLIEVVIAALLAEFLGKPLNRNGWYRSREILKEIFRKLAEFKDGYETTTAKVYTNYVSYANCPVCAQENTESESLDDGSMVFCGNCGFEFTINRQTIMPYQP